MNEGRNIQENLMEQKMCNVHGLVKYSIWCRSNVHVLPPEPVVGECVLVAVGVEEGGHVPVHRLHTVQLAIAEQFFSCLRHLILPFFLAIVHF